MARGKLITFYGVNNIGKSTHAKIVVRKLKALGHKAVYIKYPIYDIEPSGPFLHKVLRGGEQKISESELQMWFVINRYQFEKELERLLNAGYFVVAEDYVGTGIAWGVAKGLDENWLESVNLGLLKEDFSILFEGYRELRSVERGHVHEQNHDLVEKCRAELSRLADKNGWARVEVSRDIEITKKRVWSIIDLFLANL